MSKRLKDIQERESLQLSNPNQPAKGMNDDEHNKSQTESNEPDEEDEALIQKRVILDNKD